MNEIEKLQTSNKVLLYMNEGRLITNGEYISFKRENDIKILELAYSLGYIEESTWLKLSEIIYKEV